MRDANTKVINADYSYVDDSRQEPVLGSAIPSTENDLAPVDVISHEELKTETPLKSHALPVIVTAPGQKSTTNCSDDEKRLVPFQTDCLRKNRHKQTMATSIVPLKKLVAIQEKRRLNTDKANQDAMRQSVGQLTRLH